MAWRFNDPKLRTVITAAVIGVFGGCATAPNPPAPKPAAATPAAPRQPHVQPPAGPATGLRIDVTSGAEFSHYALYLKRIIDPVQQEWTGLVLAHQPRPPAGTYVVVVFHLDPHGAITGIDRVDNHSSDLGERMCLSALTNHGSFGEWTDDMKHALKPAGEELKMTFYYQ